MGNKILVEFDRKKLKQICKNRRKNKKIYTECEHCDNYKSDRILIECWLGFRLDVAKVKGEVDVDKVAKPNADDDAMYSILVGEYQWKQRNRRLKG